ncbi:GNAT family N-acetyltransferase [uncultured Methylobacterium sp.]|uniref:GNAT family N-acetyltransferase n=1 Tax=uncultured Methylobacterium sp. TaxID=157278 RepID=UPI0035CB5362
MRPAARAFGVEADETAAPGAAAWEDLFVRARAPHPHYGRHVLAAHAIAGLLPDDLRFVTVRSSGRLDALLPYRMTRDLTGLGGLVAKPFLSPFVTATAPLAADGPDSERTFDALAAGLARASGGRAWRWPLLTVDGPAGAGLLAAMTRAGWRHARVTTFARPVLDRRGTHAAFLDGHPHRARLKDLRRRTRRLTEGGAMAFETATGGPRLVEAVAAFLDLERSGWKDRAGTAMACRPAHAAFARALFCETDGPVRARADTLSLDGRPVAISLALTGGGTATLLKTAYDEDRRASAPGLLLEAEIVRACHETAFADRLDSATLAGSALEKLYRERETIAEVIAVPPGGAGPSLERRVRLARFEHQARDEARRVLRRR